MKTNTSSWKCMSLAFYHIIIVRNIMSETDILLVQMLSPKIFYCVFCHPRTRHIEEPSLQNILDKVKVSRPDWLFIMCSICSPVTSIKCLHCTCLQTTDVIFLYISYVTSRFLQSVSFHVHITSIWADIVIRKQRGWVWCNTSLLERG